MTENVRFAPLPPYSMLVASLLAHIRSALLGIAFSGKSLSLGGGGNLGIFKQAKYLFGTFLWKYNGSQYFLQLIMVRLRGIFFEWWWITERLNSFQILSWYFCFLAEVVVPQIFIQYPLMIPLENANLNKIKFKSLINFKFKFQYILFYTLMTLFFHLYKKPRGVRYRLIKA